jgi:hypothetical protein
MPYEVYCSRHKNIEQLISIRSGFIALDHVREQGVPQIENGAYTKYVSISICGTTQLSDMR